MLLSLAYTLWYLIHRKDRIIGLPRKAVITLLGIFEEIVQKAYNY